jgi:hypothetical protein
MQKIRAAFVFFMLFASWSCTEEESTPVLVSTEDILFVGGDKLRVSGRLLTNREVFADEHGFVFSTDASFSSPILLSLGQKKEPGRFIGEKSGFKIGQTYFVKAFAEVDGQRLEGAGRGVKNIDPLDCEFLPCLFLSRK